jgi:hypothetical protein
MSSNFEPIENEPTIIQPSVQTDNEPTVIQPLVPTENEPTVIQPSVRKIRLYYPTIILCTALIAVIVGTSVWALVILAPRSHDKATTATPIVTSGTQEVEKVAMETPTSTQKHTPTTATTPTAIPTKAATVAPVIKPTPTTAPVNSTAGSAMLYGTNLTLNDSSDQVLTSAATRTLLQQIHPGIVRIPMRTGMSESLIVDAATAVKSIGAAPLIILTTTTSNPNAMADDSKVLTDMQALFGSTTVYYEFGNEPDLLIGGDPTPYIALWNQAVPQLKKLAPNARFVGPSMYQSDVNYLKNFLAKANPLPDFVSWHEYTCGTDWAASVCISHIDNWTNHISIARTAMTATIGKALPIMITEWNYTADHNVAGDGKNNNPAFMTTWTTKALQVLGANGIYAAMQYSCTDAQIPLITPANTLTTQGTIFQKSPH